MLYSAIGRLRITGFLEGLSFVLLLGIAMPLKYMMGLPQAVRLIGMLHGILFILYIILSVHVTLILRWPLRRMLFLWLASVVPLGTFYADVMVLKKHAGIKAG
jgi:integral membrane protein